MASTGAAALAAHFRTKRRIFAAPGEETDALVKQAQVELKHAAEEREKVVFRFDFQLNDSAADGAKKKRKNKKKKKKNVNINSATAAELGVKEGEELNPEASHPDADSTAKGEVVASPPSTDDHAGKKTTKKKQNKKKNKTSGQDEGAAVVEAPASLPFVPAAAPKAAPSPTLPAKREVPPPPGFLKLRKPTSSDSEVMKMQLRYGRGKRNVAAIAQREKQKQAAASGGESAAGSDFQFNFF